MKPVLFDGDIIILNRTSLKALKINDIVVVDKGQHLITHRLIYKKNNAVITKGDNNYKTDQKTSYRKVLGRVNKVIRRQQTLNLDLIYIIQSSAYFREIIHITSVFKKNNIPFVVLKGLPLHLFYEKSHPRRLLADCDILIFPQDLARVADIFKRHFYSPEREVTSKQIEIEFSKTIRGVKITFDIHLRAAFLMLRMHNLNSLYKKSLFDEFSSLLVREQLRIIKIADYSLPILNPEYLFIYLSLHLFHNNFKGYNRYYLLSVILQKEKINFDLVADIIQKYDLGNFLYPVFYNLKKYYMINFPSRFLKSINISDGMLKNPDKFSINIFDDQPRIIAGINRFYLLFSLSPRRFKRFSIFMNPEFIYSFFKSILSLAKLLFIKDLLTFKKTLNRF